MMVAALLLQVSPVVAVPPAITPASRTAPLVEAACKISNVEGQQFDLSIRQSGGRGYKVTRNGSTYFPRTPLKQEIVRDTARIFAGFEFEIDSGDTWPGDAKAFKRPGQIVQMETFDTVSDTKYAILLRKKWPRSNVDFVGFCDVKKTPQAPLNSAETEEASRQ